MGFFNAIASVAKNTVMLPVEVARDVVQTVLEEPDGPTKTEQRLDKLQEEFLGELDDDTSL